MNNAEHIFVCESMDSPLLIHNYPSLKKESNNNPFKGLIVGLIVKQQIWEFIKITVYIIQWAQKSVRGVVGIK